MGNARHARTLDTVRNVVLLVGLLVVGGLFLKLRMDASRQRREVLTRLHGAGVLTGASSPTEALFRESGVPIPEAMRAGLATAAPAIKLPKGVAATPPAEQAATPTATNPTPVAAGPAPTDAAPVTDLAALFDGISLPCNLIPLPGDAGGDLRSFAAFGTSVDQAGVVTGAIGAELDRLGRTTRWIDGSTAHVSGPAGSAILSIEREPDALVVRLTAL